MQMKKKKKKWSEEKKYFVFLMIMWITILVDAMWIHDSAHDILQKSKTQIQEFSDVDERISEHNKLIDDNNHVLIQAIQSIQLEIRHHTNEDMHYGRTH